MLYRVFSFLSIVAREAFREAREMIIISWLRGETTLYICISAGMRVVGLRTRTLLHCCSDNFWANVTQLQVYV